MTAMPTVFEPNEIRREAIDHAIGQVRRYEEAVALHDVEQSELTRRQKQDVADLAHWRRRLEKIQEITAGTRAELAEARALRWAQGRLSAPAAFAEDYARYVEDVPEPRDPDLPLLSPDDFANEHAGEYETLDEATHTVGPFTGSFR